MLPVAVLTCAARPGRSGYPGGRGASVQSVNFICLDCGVRTIRLTAGDPELIRRCIQCERAQVARVSDQILQQVFGSSSGS